ncbi:uncharacterized protein LOC141913151 [Tubulanus polymorphus]|uniref:uncharacterized protein LOC141913151 n=1 Tax=Tubulanus polymorphus TaxID=672921 RepID=UPI003DA4D269
MPRRGQKSEKKPKLIFVESPISICGDRVSPVLASENPPTADVITIDSQTNIPWVSPQFRGIRNPSIRRQLGVRKPRRNNDTTSNTDHQATYIYSHRTRNRHAKIPLQFHGDQPRSPAQQFSFVDGDPAEFETPSKSLTHNRKYKKLPRGETMSTCRSVERNTTPSVSTRRRVGGEKHRATKNKTSPVKKLFSDLNTAAICEDLFESFSLRLHITPTNQNRRLFVSPRDVTPTTSARILAADTPEQDYGLSVRERRLKLCKDKYSNVLI